MSLVFFWCRNDQYAGCQMCIRLNFTTIETQVMCARVCTLPTVLCYQANTALCLSKNKWNCLPFLVACSIDEHCVFFNVAFISVFSHPRAVFTQKLKWHTQKPIKHIKTSFTLNFIGVPNKSDKWNSKWANEMLRERKKEKENWQTKQILDLCNIILLSVSLSNSRFSRKRHLLFVVSFSRHQKPNWNEKIYNKIPVRQCVFTVEIRIQWKQIKIFGLNAFRKNG